jgi:NADH:ubiquinone oxidoreductase subunit 5 (subunit L)/multisubunit Na+/H+ antiporter MnhA subunit
MPAVFLAAALPFVVSPILLLFRRPDRRAGLLSAAACAGAFACFVSVALGASPATVALPWIGPLGLSFSLHADALALFFALLITGVGFLVAAFATSYLDSNENFPRFFSFLMLFTGSMLGVVLSSNLMALFVFWEMTSFSSFLLIGFWHHRERSRYGALKALVVTGGGGLAMLLGFVMVGIVCGSFEIAVLAERGALLTASPWATPAVLLIIAGVVTKSAQLPFHLWLPSAMEAPTPVSAFLHAATMVKAGLFLVARLGPLLSVVPLWTPTLALVGLLTMTWCGWLALRQKDLKALLAFSTVSQLGLILVLLAPAEPDTTAAGLLHLLNHACFKGALFLLVGVLEHELHTRDLSLMGPLRRNMPFTWLLIALAALSMAGVPPMGGFVSKELFLDHLLDGHPLLALLAVAGAVLTAAYSFALAAGLAAGRRPDGPRGQDPSPSLLLPPAVLVAATVGLGIFPDQLVGAPMAATTLAATGSSVTGHFAVWHGVGPSLWTSVFAVSMGLALWWAWWQKRVPPAPTLVADRVYNHALEQLEARAQRLTASYMSGILWRYCSVILLTVIVGVAVVVASQGFVMQDGWSARHAGPWDLAVCATAILAAVATLKARTRLAAILALGASGFSLALLFALSAAPDLALTQIMVETISVPLFLAVFAFLPPYQVDRVRRARPLHALLAVAAGLGTALLLAASRSQRVAEPISSYFVDKSVDAAGGHNVVNVILVDFRGLDTLGEITVLGVAAIACYAIIKLLSEKEAGR